MRRHIILRLLLIKLRIDSISLHQRIMRSLLHDLTMVKHNDPVAEFAAAHAMGNVNGCFLSHKGVEVFIDSSFRNRIQSCGRLI